MFFTFSPCLFIDMSRETILEMTTSRAERIGGSRERGSLPLRNWEEVEFKRYCWKVTAPV